MAVSKLDLGWFFVFTTTEGGEYARSSGTREQVESWMDEAKRTGFITKTDGANEITHHPVHSCWIARVEDAYDSALADRGYDSTRGFAGYPAKERD